MTQTKAIRHLAKAVLMTVGNDIMASVLVVGTRNRKKLGEIVEILGDLGLCCKI